MQTFFSENDMNTTPEYELDEDISEYELERGKPTPSLEHALTQSLLCTIINTQSPHYIAFSELSLFLGENFSPTPDVAVYPKQLLQDLRLIQSGKISIPPILSIEVLSPKQSLRELFEKADNYIMHGVEEVWVIVPEIKSITVCTSHKTQKTFVSGDVKHTTTDVSVNIEQLFSL
jgi:Uma2 family endonuclease